ncbi:MAG: ArsR family transcriptional regulator [Bacteroidales bacterium]|nr:ArsR family transcriptional regulator [Bacteroidales bacterium]
MIPEKPVIPEEIREYARIAKVMGHPVRLYIIHKLALRSHCCYSGDLVEEIPIGRSTLSQHLKELKNAGLIQGEISTPYIKYCLNKDNWEKALELYRTLFGSLGEEGNALLEGSLKGREQECS